MADPEAEDQPVERDGPLVADRAEQVLGGSGAPALAVAQLGQVAGAVPVLQREDVGGLANPAVGEEGLGLLRPQPLDVEGGARDEMLQLLDRLRRADEAARTTAHRLALLADRVRAADRAFLGEGVGPAVRGAAGEVHILDLGDHVARAIDRHPVADADVAPLADRLAAAVAAGDVVLVVQCRIGDDDAADGDGQQARDRGQRAGAADLDVDAFEPGRRPLRRKLVRQRPARRRRAKAEPRLQVEPVELVDDAVDVIAQRRAPRLDLAILRQHLAEPLAAAHQRVGRKAERGEPGDRLALGRAERFADRAPGIGEEAQRPGGGDRRIELAQAAGGGVARIGEGLAARRARRAFSAAKSAWFI